MGVDFGNFSNKSARGGHVHMCNGTMDRGYANITIHPRFIERPRTFLYILVVYGQCHFPMGIHI